MTANQRSHNFDDNFRQTGKFKPLLDTSSIQQQPQPFLEICFIRPQPQQAFILESKIVQSQSKWWRLYFEENLFAMEEAHLKKTVQNCFDFLFKNKYLVDQNNADIFINVSGVLVERIKEDSGSYYFSNLDFNCLFVCLSVQSKEKTKFKIECYFVKPQKKRQEDKQFISEVFIKMKEELNLFYLIFRNRNLYLVRDRVKQFPLLQITDQNLEQSTANVPNSQIAIKNLSSRIISIKFYEYSSITKSTKPLKIMVHDPEVYQTILFKINRLKYSRFRIEQSESKQWHSFDQKLKRDNKKEAKTTPEKLKNPSKDVDFGPNINKMSNQSTNFVDEEHELYHQKNINKIKVVTQPKHLKISQRVTPNYPKESNLVASELDFVSVKDQNEKESGYYDDFQNLLYDEKGEEKQLSLNDSFEEFQKKQDDPKKKQILAELNKRREKEQEEKNTLNTLKDKITHLMNEEKQWIDKNFKLKVEIKKIQKNQTNTQQNKEILQIKNKITELKKYQKSLIEELSSIRFENNIEVLVFGEPNSNQKSDQSQREKNIINKKVFNSINGFSNGLIQPQSLASSVRSSNTAQYISRGNNDSPSSKETDKASPKPSYLKSGFFPKKINYKTVENPNKEKGEFLNIYSSVPASQSFINQNTCNMINPSSKSNVQMVSNQNVLTFSPKVPNRQYQYSNQLGSNQLFCKLSPQNSQKKIITPFTPTTKP